MSVSIRHGMKRISGWLSIAEVLPLIAGATREQRYAELGGFRVKVWGERLQTFSKGTCCVSCQLQAAYFAIDRDNGGGLHLNLYALLPDGTEVMMTSDHIHPKSKGGSDHISNRQPMCSTCNFAKGAMVAPLEYDRPVDTRSRS